MIKSVQCIWKLKNAIYLALLLFLKLKGLKNKVKATWRKWGGISYVLSACNGVHYGVFQGLAQTNFKTEDNRVLLFRIALWWFSIISTKTKHQERKRTGLSINYYKTETFPGTLGIRTPDKDPNLRA